MSGEPKLLIVVDTEEEFDWSKPFSRSNVATRSIPAQERAHAIFDRFGIVPTYVVDYPVATDPQAARFLRGLKESRRAEIGTHLHPWVTPPFVEEVNARNSYHCNLPAELERAKIEAATAAVEDSFGQRPTVFKAGRYGFGANTKKVLVELGYQVDCSQLPYTNLARDHGPDFADVRPDPYWLDVENGLLEVPLTIGFFGRAPALGPPLRAMFDSPLAERLRLPGILAKAKLVARSRLTPEGVSAAEQCALIEAMAEQGQRIFSLTYHSPSLVPGHTPYVRDEAELEAFLRTLETVLSFFRDRMSGGFTTVSEVRRSYSECRAAA
jgi:hypothetical protein